MKNIGLNGWDWAGFGAAVAIGALTLFGAVCGFKGATVRNQQIAKQSPVPPINGGTPTTPNA